MQMRTAILYVQSTFVHPRRFVHRFRRRQRQCECAPPRFCTCNQHSLIPTLPSIAFVAIDSDAKCALRFLPALYPSLSSPSAPMQMRTVFSPPATSRVRIVPAHPSALSIASAAVSARCECRLQIIAAAIAIYIRNFAGDTDARACFFDSSVFQSNASMRTPPAVTCACSKPCVRVVCELPGFLSRAPSLFGSLLVPACPPRVSRLNARRFCNRHAHAFRNNSAQQILNRPLRKASNARANGAFAAESRIRIAIRPFFARAQRRIAFARQLHRRNSGHTVFWLNNASPVFSVLAVLASISSVIRHSIRCPFSPRTCSGGVFQRGDRRKARRGRMPELLKQPVSVAARAELATCQSACGNQNLFCKKSPLARAHFTTSQFIGRIRLCRAIADDFAGALPVRKAATHPAPTPPDCSAGTRAPHRPRRSSTRSIQRTRAPFREESGD